MYVRGPGIPANQTRAHPTTHLDIIATIVELAGAADSLPKDPKYALDGKSFAQALTASPVAVEDWRTFSFSEFLNGNNTWRAVRVIVDKNIDAQSGLGSTAASASRGSPADRAGVDVRPRGPQALYTFHFWCSNQSEVFQTGSGDPWQMNNVAPGRYGKGGSTFGRAVEAKWLPLTVSLGRCKGTSECSQPALPTPGSYNKSWPLQCHDAGAVLQVAEALLDP